MKLDFDSKMSMCSLSNVTKTYLNTKLPFKFKSGGCTVSNNQLYLCFGHIDGDSRSCHFTEYPTDNIYNLGKSSIFKHHEVKIASNDGKFKSSTKISPSF